MLLQELFHMSMEEGDDGMEAYLRGIKEKLSELARTGTKLEKDVQLALILNGLQRWTGDCLECVDLVDDISETAPHRYFERSWLVFAFVARAVEVDLQCNASAFVIVLLDDQNK